MELGFIDGVRVMHSIEGELDEFIRASLVGGMLVAAHGPLYRDDPAEELLRPFHRTLEVVGYSLHAGCLAPDWAMDRARELRFDAARTGWASDVGPILEWSRAGTVLELGSRWGIRVLGLGTLHPRPKLNATVTGRFGYEGARIPNGKKWNPLTIPADERDRVLPSSPERRIAVIDFRAMDLCSMLAIVPGFIRHYDPAAEDTDLHEQTAEILGLGYRLRTMAKNELFRHAYGGESELRADFEREMPELDHLRRLPHGEGARAVQERSSRTFRAALSTALPLLVDPDCRPMFAVHDEIVLDVASGADSMAMDILRAMESGASRGPVVHRARLKWGRSYLEAKL